MELKTDDGKFITREDYRQAAWTIMHQEKMMAIMGLMKAIAVDDIDPEKGQDAANDALKLQINVLQHMEMMLFGKEKKDKKKKGTKTVTDEDTPEVPETPEPEVPETPKEEPKDEEKNDG